MLGTGYDRTKMKSGSSCTLAPYRFLSNPIKLSGGVITHRNGKEVLTDANSDLFVAVLIKIPVLHPGSVKTNAVII